MTTFGLLFVAYLAGAGTVTLAILLGQRFARTKAQEDAAHEQAQRFMAWADTAEFNDAARAFNDRRVRENRRAADQSPPHTLALLRDEHDRKHGGSW